MLFDPLHIDECMFFSSEIDKKEVCFLRFGLDKRYELAMNIEAYPTPACVFF